MHKNYFLLKHSSDKRSYIYDGLLAWFQQQTEHEAWLWPKCPCPYVTIFMHAMYSSRLWQVNKRDLAETTIVFTEQRAEVKSDAQKLSTTKGKTANLRIPVLPSTYRQRQRPPTRRGTPDFTPDVCRRPWRGGPTLPSFSGERRVTKAVISPPHST